MLVIFLPLKSIVGISFSYENVLLPLKTSQLKVLMPDVVYRFTQEFLQLVPHQIIFSVILSLLSDNLELHADKCRKQDNVDLLNVH